MNRRFVFFRSSLLLAVSLLALLVYWGWRLYQIVWPQRDQELPDLGSLIRYLLGLLFLLLCIGLLAFLNYRLAFRRWMHQEKKTVVLLELVVPFCLAALRSPTDSYGSGTCLCGRKYSGHCIAGGLHDLLRFYCRCAANPAATAAVDPAKNGSRANGVKGPDQSPFFV